jgi:hypothetical protein
MKIKNKMNKVTMIMEKYIIVIGIGYRLKTKNKVVT